MAEIDNWIKEQLKKGYSKKGENRGTVLRLTIIW